MRNETAYLGVPLGRALGVIAVYRRGESAPNAEYSCARASGAVGGGGLVGRSVGRLFVRSLVSSFVS